MAIIRTCRVNEGLTIRGRGEILEVVVEAISVINDTKITRIRVSNGTKESDTYAIRPGDDIIQGGIKIGISTKSRPHGQTPVFCEIPKDYVVTPIKRGY